MDTSRQTSGSFSQQQGGINYSTPAVSLSNYVKDGQTAILIVQERGGSEPRVWSTGDPEQTQHLFKQATTSLAFSGQRQPEPTS